MRKVVLGLGFSLDGYIARLDGSVDFLFMPKDYSMGPFFATIDTAIMGRKTYEVSLKMGGAGSSGGSSMTCYALSRSLPPGKRDGIIFSKDSPAALIEQIRKRPGRDIWLMGGGEIAREFLKADLVDELYLGGSGLPSPGETRLLLCCKKRCNPATQDSLGVPPWRWWFFHARTKISRFHRLPQS